MSTFFSFFAKLAVLDIGWFFGFVLDNLFWVFVFAAIVYILFEGQKFFLAFVVFVFAMWLWSDFEAITGVGLFGAKILAIYYTSKIALLTVVENNSILRKHFVVISSITGVAAIIVANIFV